MNKFFKMKKESTALILYAALSVATASALAEETTKYMPLHIGAFTEYGKVEKGSEVGAYGSDAKISNQTMTRTASWLSQNVVVKERLEISAGISGLFWYSLPETEGLPHTRLLKFATGITAASGTYTFGNLENPYLKLKMGFFPYKYNPDAQNLGEYLFRSGTYPGYLWTGGWTLLNTASYGANGVQGSFEFLDKKLKVDANIFIERDIEPSFDLSPSVVVNYNHNGLFEIGAGAVFSHLIQANPDKVSPQERRNAYYNGMPLPDNQFKSPGFDLNDTLIVLATDPRYGTSLDKSDPRFQANPNLPPVKYVTLEENGVPNSQLNYYTFQGTKLMGRASINTLKFLEDGNLFEEGAGKIYGEIALLGVKNYPFYYEHIMERMPMMVGINIPTFKILDNLSVEMEYYKSRFANSIKTEFNKTLPVWDVPADPASYVTDTVSQERAKSRSLYWSVYAKKKVAPGFVIIGQAAHDHTRAINYVANPTYQPITQANKDWYWAIRVEFSI